MASLCTLIFMAFVALTSSAPADDVSGWDSAIAYVVPIKEPFADIDDVDTRGIIQDLKTMEVKKKCDCEGQNVCGCCVMVSLKDEPRIKACANMTDVTDTKKVEMSLVFNEKKLFSKSFGDVDKCAGIPYTGKVAKACMRSYNMSVDNKGIHACLKVSLRLLTKEAINFDFDCLLLGGGRLVYEKPSAEPGTGMINVDVGQHLPK